MNLNLSLKYYKNIIDLIKYHTVILFPHITTMTSPFSRVLKINTNMIFNGSILIRNFLGAPIFILRIHFAVY